MSIPDEALSQFSDQIHLVITDLNMPGDGINLIKRIRKTSAVPIIIVSAFQSQYADRLRRMGHLVWLSKPLDFDSLLDAVVVELGLAQPAAEHAAAQV